MMLPVVNKTSKIELIKSLDMSSIIKYLNQNSIKWSMTDMSAGGG